MAQQVSGLRLVLWRLIVGWWVMAGLLGACSAPASPAATSRPVAIAPSATVAAPTPTLIVLSPFVSATPVIEAPACENPYYPLRQGATWTYALAGYDPPERTQIVTEVSNTVLGTSSLIDTIGITTTEVLCDAGGLQFKSPPTLAGIPANLAVLETTSTEGYYLLPAEQLTPGTTWRVHYSLEADVVVVEDTVGQIKRLSYGVTLDLQVIGPERVSVPAGTFDALKITQHVETGGSRIHEPPISFDLTLWFARGVGLVKSMRGDTVTIELKSYNIPAPPANSPPPPLTWTPGYPPPATQTPPPPTTTATVTPTPTLTPYPLPP